jgi:AcrR family transcriptional regulator
MVRSGTAVNRFFTGEHKVGRMKATRTKSKKPPPKAAAQAPVRERVLNAAFSAFMEKGYAGTSTLEIATRAKVSKRELYQLCGDKPALLRDCITERAQRMRLPLELPAAKDRKALATTLTAFGTAILRGVCDPAVRAVYWLAISQSLHAPEVAQALDKSGRGAARAALARTLAQAQADGLIGAGDPAAMAVEFFALLWGDLLLQLLLRVADPPTPQAMERKARDATEKFLRLYPQPRA